MRVDTAQRITQWCWSGVGNHRRTAAATNLADQSSQSAEHVVVNYTTEEPEHMPRANDHEGRQCNLPQSVSGENQRQSHCQEASGEKKNEVKQHGYEDSEKYIEATMRSQSSTQSSRRGETMKRTEKSKANSRQKSKANSRQE